MQLEIAEAADNDRADRAITDALVRAGIQTSVREVKAALRDGRLRIDGRKVAAGVRVRAGAKVDASAFVPKAASEILPDLALLSRCAVVFEDDDVLVLDKPSGVFSLPLRVDDQSTLLHAAVAHAPAIAQAGPPLEGGAVHRLDRETSGLVVFAKNEQMRSEIRQHFAAHQVVKRYDAVVRGQPEVPLEVALPFAPTSGPTSRLAASDAANSLPAKTRIVRAAVGQRWSRIDVETSFGRRHQVRVHLAAAQHPIAGDARYGEAADHRLMLHASAVRVPGLPEFQCSAPLDFERAWERLTREA